MTATDLVGMGLISQMEKFMVEVGKHDFPKLYVTSIPNDPDLDPEDEQYAETHYLTCPWHTDEDALAARDEALVGVFGDLHESILWGLEDDHYESRTVTFDDPEILSPGLLYVRHNTCGKPCDLPVDFAYTTVS